MSPASSMGCLELVWTDAAKMTVTACRIVKFVDVTRYVLNSSFSVGVDSLLDPLLFQATEEGLNHCIVPTVSSPTHAWLEPVGLAEAPPSIAPILGSLIRVDHGLAGPSATNSFRNSLKNQIPADGRFGRPSDDLAREKVHDHSQIQLALPGSDIGDVRHPDLVGVQYRELALQQVGNQG